MLGIKKTFRLAFNLLEERLAAIESGADINFWPETTQKMENIAQQMNNSPLAVDLLLVVFEELERRYKKTGGEPH